MKTFREFIVIAEKAAIPMTPEQIAVGRARRAAAAQRLAQNATNPGERAAAAAASERMRAVPSETIRGNNPSSQSQPGSTVNSSSTAQPQSSTRTAQTYSNQGVGRQDNTRSTQTPNAQTSNASWKSRVPQPLRNVGRAGIRTLGGVGALGAVDAARQGDVAGAVEQGILAGSSSRRVNQAVSRTGLRAVQGAASRLGVKGAAQIGSRFIPGLSTAYGVARGTSALNRGDYLGAALGYGSAIPVVGGVAAAADIARDVIDDPNERYKRIATSGVRSARQVAAKANTYGANKGSALTGIGGPTSVSQNKDGTGFMSTGSGSQRKTVQLAKTQLVKDPTTGKQRVGDLAYKGGKAVYLARPSAASSDTTLLSRLSRATGIGGQRERDAAAAKQ